MKIIKIEAEKQDNGIWGSPLNLVESDFYIMKSEKNYLIHSAICVAISELHKKEFRISMSDENGFVVWIRHFGACSVKYSKYEVFGDTLYEFKDEQEHIAFLRNQKLKKLYEYI